MCGKMPKLSEVYHIRMFATRRKVRARASAKPSASPALAASPGFLRARWSLIRKEIRFLQHPCRADGPRPVGARHVEVARGHEDGAVAE